MKKLVILMMLVVCFLAVGQDALGGWTEPYADDAGTIALWHMNTIVSDKYIYDDDSVVTDRNAQLILAPNPVSTSGGPVLTDPATTAGLDFPGGNSAFGNCIDLDGVDDYAVIGSTNISLDASNVRFEGWFKSDAAVDNQIIFDRWGQIVIYAHSDKFTALAWDGVGGANYCNATSAGFDPTAWNHIAVEVVGTSSEMYLNGVLAGSDTLTDGFSTTLSKTSTYIGMRYNGSNRFAGYVDEFRIAAAVPEPATLALLGLGGLLIRKKRK